VSRPRSVMRRPPALRTTEILATTETWQFPSQVSGEERGR
jgi:hypothetical protein